MFPFLSYRSLIPLLLLGIAWPCKAAAQVDTLFTLARAGRDSCPVTVVYRVEAPALTSPFRWRIEVRDVHGEEVFSRCVLDTLIDPLFHERNLLPRCSGYAGCKRAYYFERIPAAAFRRTVLPASSGVFDRNSPGSLYHLAAGFLTDTLALPEGESAHHVQEIARMLLGVGGWVLSVPSSPLLEEPPLVYYPPLNRFIPIYAW
jgi:hypothetical protein